MKSILFISIFLSLAFSSLGQNTYSILHDYDNQPLYQPDFNLIKEGLSQKQALLNQRRQIIQKEYDNITQAITSIMNKRPTKAATEQESKYFLEFKTLLNKYANYDLTDDRIYSQVITWINEQKMYFSTWK